MGGIRLLKAVPVANTLGEGVIWDDLAGVFLWTDIHERKLYRYHPESDGLSVRDTPERLCSFGLVAGDPDLLICAFESGIALYHPNRGEVLWLAKPEAGITGTRFNDGRVDRQGRFWSGTMVEADQALDERGNPVTASLYRVERDRCTRMETGLRITNSLCWSLDSRTQYLADSPSRSIYSYEFDPEVGRLRERRVFARTDPPVEPDGSCIDAEDHLWNARWGGGEVVRHRAGGSVALTFPVPVTQPTCVCFGGPALSWLAVTTARDGLSEPELAKQPQAGALFLYETGFRGVPEGRYVRGDSALVP